MGRDSTNNFLGTGNTVFDILKGLCDTRFNQNAVSALRFVRVAKRCVMGSKKT